MYLLKYSTTLLPIFASLSIAAPLEERASDPHEHDLVSLPDLDAHFSWTTDEGKKHYGPDWKNELAFQVDKNLLAVGTSNFDRVPSTIPTGVDPVVFLMGTTANLVSQLIRDLRNHPNGCSLTADGVTTAACRCYRIDDAMATCAAALHIKSPDSAAPSLPTEFIFSFNLLLTKAADAWVPGGGSLQAFGMVRGT
ncbi:MAG: hypothetical protein M1833_005542 [Piccolia ochrophora]|nr:MAG: hypothetical protein M1833_005542 [Piccolia ochrophora]